MADIVNYNHDFENIITIIEQAKMRAIKAVNTEMIDMYWQIGKYISEKAEQEGWGKSVVQDFAQFLRVTGIIRTRPKTAIFKSFRRFTLERRQPSCGFNPKNPIKIPRLRVEDFLQ